MKKTPWSAAGAVLLQAGMLVAAWVFLPSAFRWVFGLFAGLSLLLSVASFVAQIRLRRRLDALCEQNNTYKSDLESVLISTEDAQRSLATSMAVGQRITSILDLDSLLVQVSNLIQQRFNLYAVRIYLFDPESETLSLHASLSSQPGAGGSISPDSASHAPQPAIQWCAQHRRPLRIDDTTSDERFARQPDLPKTRSLLALPLEFGAQVLGVLDLRSAQPANFKEDSIPFIQLLADQVATAIHNARLFQAEKDRRRLTENFYDVGRALSCTLDPTEVVELILQYLVQLVPCDRAAIILAPNEISSQDENCADRQELLIQGSLHLAAQSGFAKDWPNQAICCADSPALLKIFTTQEPLAIQNPDEVLNSYEKALWNQNEDADLIQTWLGVPLAHSNQMLGILCLMRVTPAAFTKNEITLAETLAVQGATAIRNANLYQQITRFNQDLEKLVQQRTFDTQKAYDQLERLDQAKSDFVALASHELRTPLTVVQGYSQMLLDEPEIENNPRYALLVHGILSGVQRLLEIIESLLDVAKIDNRALVVYPTPVSVLSLVQNIQDRLNPEICERKITISHDLANVPSIQGDLDGLRKAFYHLIINAIKFTPDGGRISITGRVVPPGYHDLKTQGVEIVIQDTGIGIAPENQELIFYKFFSPEKVLLHSTGRTKFKGKGAGLGLSIAKGIVDAHHGAIWVESQGFDEAACPGSQFHIVLPEEQGTSVSRTA